MVKSDVRPSTITPDIDVPAATSIVKDAMLLPTHATLPDGRHVTITEASDHQLSEVYTIVQQAAMNDEGFGADEFPTEKHFRNEIDDGKVFLISTKDSGKMVAALVITTSKYYRGQTVADLYIIVKAEERRKGIGEFCLRTSVEYCRRLGFMGIYADTFSNNVAMRKIIEKTAGFQMVSFLPVGGCLQDGTIVGSIIFYKDLRTLPPVGTEERDGGGADDRPI